MLRVISSVPRLFLVAGLLLYSSFAFAQGPISHYERKIEGASTVIVFVHGIFGDAKSTWTNQDAYWPGMIISDPTFNGADVFVYAYPADVWATLSIDELAESMRSVFNSYGLPKYQSMVFLSHSMGGLVTRDYLIKNRQVAARTKFAYFFPPQLRAATSPKLQTYYCRILNWAKCCPLRPTTF
jgi:triacylglycerol esterase/lipase EstA (alpha/beta hydrolase family)